MPNWRKVIVSGSDAALNTLIVTNGITGSLLGTASYATQALSSSYAVTASYVLNAVSSSFASTASFVTGSNVFGPFGSNSVVSASYALTASYSPNLVISGSIANVDYIDFNTGSATPAWFPGRVYWDNTDGTLAVYNAEADITLQVGQESWVRVFNQTGLLITDGTPVRLVGAQGDVPKIVLAQSAQVSGSALGDNQIIGVATHDIETNSIGYVTTQGIVRGLNTNAFTDGDLLFVSSSAGVLTNVIPPAPYEVIQVGICVKAGPGGSGIIFVFPTQPIDFGDLASAERGTYQYGDIWSYQQTGSVGVWKHGRSLSGSYSITGSLNVTGGITGSLLGTASYANVAALGGFVQDGNSFGALATLGTNDNQSLAIETNGTTRMFVSSSGNVGIGTTTPLRNLDIFANNPEISTRIASSGVGKFSFRSSIDAEYGGISLNANSGEMKIFTGTTYFPTFYSSNAEAMRIATTGNVLIGTTTDNGGKLQVQSTITNGVGTEAIRAYGSTNYIGMHYDEGRAGVFTTNYIGVGGNSPGSFGFYTSAGTQLASIGTGGLFSHNVNGKIANGNNIGYINLWNGSNGNTELVNTGNYSMTFSTNNIERGRFTNTGNFGIGTTSPSEKLHIEGTSNPSIRLYNPTHNGNLMITSYAGGLVYLTNAYSLGKLGFGTNSRTNDITIDKDGLVGIGISTPTARLHVVGTTYLSGSTGTVSGSSLTVYGSGSALPVFTVQGSQGELFSVTDSLSGSLFSVNDISGLPILEVFSDNTTLMGSYQAPSLNTTIKTTTVAGNNVIYSIPTASYNGAWFEYVATSASNARAGQIMSVCSSNTIKYTETTTTDIGTTAGLNFMVMITGSNFALTGSSTTAGWTIKTIVRSI